MDVFVIQSNAVQRGQGENAEITADTVRNPQNEQGSAKIHYNIPDFSCQIKFPYTYTVHI
jgi:hypothetical protein